MTVSRSFCDYSIFSKISQRHLRRIYSQISTVYVEGGCRYSGVRPAMSIMGQSNCKGPDVLNSEYFLIRSKDVLRA